MSLLVKGKKQKKWCGVSVAWCGLSLLVRGEIKLRVVVFMLRCCVDISLVRWEIQLSVLVLVGGDIVLS